MRGKKERKKRGETHRVIRLRLGPLGTGRVPLAPAGRLPPAEGRKRERRKGEKRREGKRKCGRACVSKLSSRRMARPRAGGGLQLSERGEVERKKKKKREGGENAHSPLRRTVVRAGLAILLDESFERE